MGEGPKLPGSCTQPSSTGWGMGWCWWGPGAQPGQAAEPRTKAHSAQLGLRGSRHFLGPHMVFGSGQGCTPKVGLTIHSSSARVHTAAVPRTPNDEDGAMVRTAGPWSWEGQGCRALGCG